MDKMLNMFSVYFGTIGGMLAYLLGGFDMLIKALIICIVLDYVTGVLKAIYLKEVTSEIGYKGIIKKIYIILLVALANIVDQSLGLGVGMREICISFFICNEGISILENAAQSGVRIPEKLKAILLQIRSENNESTNESVNRK